MKSAHKKLILAAGIICFSIISKPAFSSPASCLFIHFYNLQKIPNGILTDSTSNQEQARYTKITIEAKKRIVEVFGEPLSNPIIVYFNDPNLFKTSLFGSAQIIGSRVCVLIGPKGQNIDVVAHELMHAEINERVGSWSRFMKIPTWFDEGLAMQVDYREKYKITDAATVDLQRIKKLTSFSSFFDGSEDAIVNNYGQSRSIVGDWVIKVGKSSVYQLLEELRDGKSFDDIFNQRNNTQ